MLQSTIYESFTLPSKGLIYDKGINPEVTLRSMTTAEEMQRLSPTDTPYKVMSDIIEACMREKPEIHVYNLSLGDYQFLLHKLRIVTYGPDYKMVIHCPKCGEMTEAIANLDSLEVNEWDNSYLEDKLITLPVTNKTIELKFQSPKDLDVIAYKTKEMKKRTKSNIDYSILYTVASLIKSVDGKNLNSIELEEFVKSLPMNDVNYLLNKSTLLEKKVGIDTSITAKCSQCGEEITTSFRITSEFFGPTNY